MLGNTRSLRLDEEGARQRLADLGATLGVDVDPDTVTSDLSLGAQQQVEIINALWRGSRLLILDEPTSMLTPQGFAELGKVITRLKGQGLAVVFITHKLHEALALGDRVSILRQGRVVGSLEPERMRQSSQDELRAEIIHTMFGDEARHVAGAPELQDQLQEREEPRAAALENERGARARGRPRRRRRRGDGHRGRLADGAPGRGARHRRGRRQRAARARGGGRPASAPSPRGRSACSARRSTG